MDAVAQHQLLEGARALGVPLDGPTLDGGRLAAFDRYLTLLLRWNARIKLTSVTEPTEVVARHFLDSLAVVPALAGGPGTLVDVGSGAGFPGLVVALVRPDLAVKVVESIQKKAAFLEAVRRELALSNVEVVADRMETLVRARRTFDAAVSRATFAPEVWVRQGVELVAPGGRLVAMVVPGPSVTVEALAPHWPETFAAAALNPPYAAGRALLVLTGRRAGGQAGTR